MSTKKISQLDNVGISLSDSGQLTPSTLIIPVYTRDGNNTTINGSINLPYLVQLIYSKVAQWAAAAMDTGDYEEPSSPSGGGSGGSGVSLEAFNALKSRVTALENGSSGGSSGGGSVDLGTFPTHTIRVISQNGITSYSLPCAPDSENETIEINLISGETKFTVSLTVTNVKISGTNISAMVSATVTKGGGTGGTLSSINVSGNFICGSGGGQGFFGSQEMVSSSYTVGDMMTTHSVTLNGDGATGSTATVNIVINVNNNSNNQITITDSTNNMAQGTIYVT